MNPLKLMAVLIAIPFFSLAQSNVINTIAGNGSQGYTGDGGSATQAELDFPERIEVDSAGNVYFMQRADKVIRKVTPVGIIATYTGGGGSFNDGIPVADAVFLFLSDIKIDKVGNMYIADRNKLRKVDVTTGLIHTICGDGSLTDAGDGGLAINASIIGPSSIAVDNDGNIYLATFARIRKIDAATGIITTICGDGSGTDNSGVGAPAVNAKIETCTAMCTDDAGNVYFANKQSFIGKIDLNGIFHQVAGNNVGGYTGDGGLATNATATPLDLDADNNGNLYFTDIYGHVRVINAQGIIYTIAGKPIVYLPAFSGDGGEALLAEMRSPRGIGLDTCGNIYIADYGNHRVRKVSGLCGTLSAESIVKASATFSIFPNPAASELIITSDRKITQLDVYNMVGQVFLQTAPGKEKLTVDVQPLPPGIYFVKVNNNHVEKFVKE